MLGNGPRAAVTSAQVSRWVGRAQTEVCHVTLRVRLTQLRAGNGAGSLLVLSVYMKLIIINNQSMTPLKSDFLKASSPKNTKNRQMSLCLEVM